MKGSDFLFTVQMLMIVRSSLAYSWHSFEDLSLRQDTSLGLSKLV
jgi:hypothetical protein